MDQNVFEALRRNATMWATAAASAGIDAAVIEPIHAGLSLRVPALLARLEAARKPGAAPAPMLAWEEMTAAERFSRAGLTLEHAFGAQALFKYWQAVLVEVQAEARWDEEVDQQLKPAFLTTWAESSQAASSKSGAKAGSSVRARNAAKKKPEAAWKDVIQGSGSAAEGQGQQ
ncbi:uncharacterized protein HaLaN_18015 [Haematococcus lacustris]|uniref:Uncharacterized protein n=1 Tax=Haematococcus lacustris TaxID=44745 RepID=A0A699ZPK1_HAELA|nr:uncharacterized protein HaLaN_18015 [Haematococcus lacustris]